MNFGDDYSNGARKRMWWGRCRCTVVRQCGANAYNEQSASVKSIDRSTNCGSSQNKNEIKNSGERQSES